MKIKKLELLGFKSFKDKTVIQFDQGITGIVGPNGCGKSNIVDALMWVMGETSAKHLRGAHMEDVIFNGAQGYAPMGLAEVSLTLENDGGPFPAQYMKFSEIMVTRRLHRDGESEYLINKEPARLKDVQEIFMDTGAGAKGFSIIAQGMISRMVEAKPEDRKHLIEEAAGITKFKVRKRESQRKLEATEQNLVRLNDIVVELKRQLDSLERQAQRAERYRGLKIQLEEKELWLFSKEFLKLESQYKIETEAVTNFETELSGLVASVATEQAEAADLRTQVLEKEQVIQDRSQVIEDKRLELRTLEHEIQELRIKLEQAKASQESAHLFVQEARYREQSLSQELERVSGELETLQSKLTVSHENLLSKEAELSRVKKNTDQSQARLNQIRREFISHREAFTQAQTRAESLSDSLAQYREREDSVREVLVELQNQNQEFESRRKRLWNDFEKNKQLQLDRSKDLETLQHNLELTRVSRDALQDEVNTKKDILNEVTGKLYGLENLASSFEGFEEGVKSVIQWSRLQEDRKLIPVSEVVEVPVEYELAMEAALGPRLQALMAQDAEQSLQAIHYLKEQKKGRSTFMSLDGSQVVEDSGSVPYRKLVDEIKVPEQHSQVVHNLMGRIAIVDNLEQVIGDKARVPGWSYVTLEGDLIDQNGFISGGTRESVDSGLLKRRREIKELSLAREEAVGKLALLKAQFEKAEDQFKNLSKEVELAVTDQNQFELKLLDSKKEFERSEQELGNSNQAIVREERDLHSLESQRLSRENDLEQLVATQSLLKEKGTALETEIDALTNELQSSEGMLSALSSEVASAGSENVRLETEVLSSTREKARLEQGLYETRTKLGQSTNDQTQSETLAQGHSQLIEESRVRAESLGAQISEMESERSQLRNQFEEISHKLRDLESKLSKVVFKQSDIQSQKSQSEMRKQETQLRLEHIKVQVLEKYHLDLAESAEGRAHSAEFDETLIESEIKELRDKLSRIGEVNLSAIEEFKSISERYQFLSQQQNDLLDAKDQLTKVIDRINRIVSRRFKDTFIAVNERFSKVFPVLFGGGEAELILIEDEESGEMGIDIKAKPPGKNPQSVSLLSGGEKALTAVSLIFSIFLVKPSPYCLLDEVDAPLDDANVTRFNDLVHEMSKRSQIILVTHNKYTMEAAARLYGVTMEERGVSKMVTVNLSDAAKLVEV